MQRSRLELHKEKEFKRKVIIMVVLLVLLIIFMFVIGFQLIIKGSVFFGSLGNNKKTTQTTDTDNFYGSLDLDNLPMATNSAQLQVSGSANNFKTVEFYINNKKVKSDTVDSSNNFADTVGDLQKGKNDIYVKAISGDNKHQKSSSHYTVTYKSDKPALDISSPTDNSKTNQQTITITGKTDPGVTVKVNNSPAVVDVNGGFQQDIKLNDGDNKIEISVEDDAGNIATKELTVNYQKDE